MSSLYVGYSTVCFVCKLQDFFPGTEWPELENAKGNSRITWIKMGAPVFLKRRTLLLLQSLCFLPTPTNKQQLHQSIVYRYISRLQFRNLLGQFLKWAGLNFLERAEAQNMAIHLPPPLWTGRIPTWPHHGSSRYVVIRVTFATGGGKITSTAPV